MRARSLMAGWIAGLGTGTWMIAGNGFKTATYTIHVGALAMPVYAAVIALLVNFVVVLASSLLFVKPHEEGVEGDLQNR
ncbi:hypothetical protein QFZ98_006374 [Paraburkholderia youngii]